MIYKLVIFFVLLAGLAKSQDTVKVAVELSPEQLAEQDYNKGLLALKTDDYNTAVDLFSKCLAVKPSFDKAFANRAIAFTHLKKYNEALADINFSIKINPQNPEPYFNKSLIFFRAS